MLRAGVRGERSGWTWDDGEGQGGRCLSPSGAGRVLEAGWIFLGTLLVLYKWRYLFWAYLFLTYLFCFFIEMQALVKTAS